mmetsp:Transcript_6221/g.10167  ORF Transcript_6221/g.10167 Transcript_6221/m.10167 type:complete len:104 (+) Transcript_6221:108-419(+)
MQGEFEELCTKYKLAEEIAAASSHQLLRGNSSSSGAAGESAVQSTMNELRRVEEEEMSRLIQELENENAQLLESRRVMAQKIDEQIAAVEEEEGKMRVVVDKL